MERIAGWRASAEMFSVLGVSPALGRPFSSEEDHPGAGNFVVISDSLWKTHFAADRNILGTKLDLDGVPHSVIGVMPPGFHVFPYAVEQYWEPLQMETQATASTPRTVHWILGMVRLDQGASIKSPERVGLRSRTPAP